jgi:hypothetical protein
MCFAISLAAFGYAAHFTLAGVVAALATLLVMALPGVLLVRGALPEEKSALAVLVFGAVLGLALGRLGLAAAGLLFGPGPLGPALLLAALALASAVAFFRLGRAAVPAWGEDDSREVPWLVSTLAALFLVLAVPYWGVGRATPSGSAFTPYFDRDYLNHVAITAELARGLPPENPYFAGERLHYYWGYHLWPAALKGLTGVSAREALNLTILPTVGLFVAALCLWLRPHVNGRAARYGAAALGLLAFSYIGPLFLVKQLAPGLVSRLPMVSNQDYSFLSHSWFRDFLYEPHAVTALTLLLAVLALNQNRPAPRRILAGCLTGVALGVMLATDAFIGLLTVTYFAAAHAYGFVREAETRRPLLLAAAVTTAAGLAAVALGIFPLGERTVRFALHPAAKLAPVYLLVELGPLFLLGAVGTALVAYRRATRPLWPLLFLLALALLVAFTLQVPVEPNIVIRKSLKVAQLPLLVFVGVALLAAAAWRHRAAWGLAVAAVVLPGLVTLVTDNALYLDLVRDRSPQPTYVSQDELELLGWVRDNTPPDAVLLMAYPDRIFGQGTPLLIEGLGERRTYFGNSELPHTFQVPETLIEQRLGKVRALFAAADGPELLRVLEDLPPLYLYVADDAGPAAALRQLEVQGVLRHVYRSGRFSLKQVLRQPASRGAGPAGAGQSGQDRVATNMIAPAHRQTR